MNKEKLTKNKFSIKVTNVIFICHITLPPIDELNKTPSYFPWFEIQIISYIKKKKNLKKKTLQMVSYVNKGYRERILQANRNRNVH